VSSPLTEPTRVTATTQNSLHSVSLGPFYRAIAVPSVTRCRCCRWRRRGHRCAGGSVCDQRRRPTRVLGDAPRTHHVAGPRPSPVAGPRPDTVSSWCSTRHSCASYLADSICRPAADVEGTGATCARRPRQLKLAFHGADTDTDTDTDTDFLARIIARKSRVSDVRMYRRVGRVGVRVGVDVGVVECQLNCASRQTINLGRSSFPLASPRAYNCHLSPSDENWRNLCTV